MARQDIPKIPRQRAAVDAEALLTPAEVAALFRVDPKTVARWASSGRLPAVRTPGGHRRYRAREVMALLDPAPVTAQAVPVRTSEA